MIVFDINPIITFNSICSEYGKGQIYQCKDLRGGEGSYKHETMVGLVRAIVLSTGGYNLR